MIKTMLTATTLALLTMIAVDMTEGTPPPPAIGDIRLVQYSQDGLYEVQIYFTDGVQKPGWGAICADTSSRNEAVVICRQMGYKLNKFSSRNTDTPVWLNQISCDRNSAHILRCQHSVVPSNQRGSEAICEPSNEKLLVDCDFESPLDFYDGQVALCPSDDAINNATTKTSTSYGVISLYFDRNDQEVWRGVNLHNISAPLGSNEADAICRQMGYTGSITGTIITRSASEYSFENCYTGSNPPFQLEHAAWMTTEQLHCPGPQKCLGCCYQYPTEICGQCNQNQDLVIGCTFDPAKAMLSTGTGGTAEECALDNDDKITNCEADNSGCTGDAKTIQIQRMVIGVLAALLLILGPLGIATAFKLYKKYLYQRCLKALTCTYCRKYGNCCQCLNDELQPLINQQNQENAQE